MKRVFILITVVIVLFVTMPGPVSGADFSVSGYYKSFFMGFDVPDYKGVSETEPPLGSANNRLRLKLSYSPSDWLSIHAAYDISPRIQDVRLIAGDVFFAGIAAPQYRADDFYPRLYPAKGKPEASFGLYHNLDRFFVTIKTDFADFFIGRQAIAWGSAHFINPTDIIAPFTFNELDSEERRGVDAVRVRIPLGTMDELDIGYIFGDDMKLSNSAFYVRGKTYLWKTDISLIAMGFRENLMLGADVTRSVGGAGAWLEAAYVITDVFKKNRDPEYFLPGSNRDYVRVSLGMDYNFTADLYAFFEYHYNSAGKSEPEQYEEAFLSTAYTEGAVYLMGKHYLNFGVTYQISPLIPFSGIVFYNISDGSITLAPSAEYNIAENIYLSLGAYIGIGKKPEIYPSSTGPVLRLHSEFGAYPAMLYTSFRFYF